MLLVARDYTQVEHVNGVGGGGAGHELRLGWQLYERYFIRLYMCIGGTGKTREYENETRKNRLVRQQMFGLKEVSAWATETAEILPPYIL